MNPNNPPMTRGQRRAWLALEAQNRRRERALVLTSDGHGRLAWVCNVPVQFGFNVSFSSDGLHWSDGYDATTPDRLWCDCSGEAGFFRVAGTDDGGNSVPPFSNVVRSDGM
jgi:hypothetical protein